MINFVLIMAALCTLVEFGFFLFVIFAAKAFIKDVWKYWTEQANVGE